jgi:hypothetical protein
MMRLSNIHIFIQVQLWKLESGICIVVDHIHVFRHPNTTLKKTKPIQLIPKVLVDMMLMIDD